ncbi:transport protein particle component-domain-containing protein [Aspergillus stella-maris]|uniref:transport protein particle component-domain-containing protein n=1 Tax=Aspergillus stella-maris TaxID=1810926 RepID=UPI003CCD36C9
MASGQLSELQSVIALIKTLTNAQLKDILRFEGLAVSGVKAALQIRIIESLERHYQTGQLELYDSLRKFIYGAAHRALPPSSSVQQSALGHQYQHPSTNQSMPSHHRPSPMGMSLPSHGSPSAREHTRDSVELRIVLDADMASRLSTDSKLRIMVFCAADTGLNQFTKSDIAFPHQVELKANLDEVKANLRGLKNKPGTTRPADITNYLRKKAGYTNHVVMTYALTQKRFFVVANLVECTAIEELVRKLKQRKTITKEQVLQEMKSKAQDADIVATSTVMSLKCPLSTQRIQVPCRSVLCTHNQCFDAASFLQLQEQAPTWTCPVCAKATSYESLNVDQYVDDILHSTPVNMEQVTIEPNGRWFTPQDEAVAAAGTGGVTPGTDDDELIEIREPGITPVKQEPAVLDLFQQTPARSREQSSAWSTNKRPAPVIDLTGSDEDDDDDGSPVRPPKRQAVNLPRPLPRHDPRSPYRAPRPPTTMSFDASSTTPNVSDPRDRLVGASCLDFLLIELVPMAERIAKDLAAEDRLLDDEETKETAFFRLESLGYRVGQGLAERFSRDRPRFADNLDVIKFLCKDLWTTLFKKQIDNLKTNHRGVYVLTDNSFRPFARMSMAVRGEAVSMAQAYLWFPCGVIRGALSNLGIHTTVQAETTELPGATFQIKTINKP